MGMFAKEYKQPIPAYVKRLGIVTAPTGAAVRDIQNICASEESVYSADPYPALVQGDGAKESIVQGLETLDSLGLDVIIVGRGGGSIEDLWAFNEEVVARAIFNCRTPVISAVGHETDTTIADFVADLRARSARLGRRAGRSGYPGHNGPGGGISEASAGSGGKPYKCLEGADFGLADTLELSEPGKSDTRKKTKAAGFGKPAAGIFTAGGSGQPPQAAASDPENRGAVAAAAVKSGIFLCGRCQRKCGDQYRTGVAGRLSADSSDGRLYQRYGNRCGRENERWNRWLKWRKRMRKS